MAIAGDFADFSTGRPVVKNRAHLGEFACLVVRSRRGLKDREDPERGRGGSFADVVAFRIPNLPGVVGEE